MIIKMLEKFDDFGDVIRLLPSHLRERVRVFPFEAQRPNSWPPI